MDKLIINEWIVKMRNSVSQARVHTFNKLSRQIKHLENKKGTDKQKENNHRKAERFKEEIHVLKRIHNDEISKYALLSTEHFSELLNKVSVSIEERTKARVAGHRSVVLQVETFRAKYPDWDLKLPPLLVQLGLQYKYQKLEKGRNNYVSSEPIVNKSIEEASITCEDLHKNIESECINENPIDHESPTIDGNKRNKITNARRKEFVNKSEKKKVSNGIAEVRRFADLLEITKLSENSSDDKTFTLDNEDSNSTNCADNISVTEDGSKREKIANMGRKELVNKRERKKLSKDIAEVRRFADLLELARNSENPKDDKLFTSDEGSNSTNHVVDPFFLTGDISDESGNDLNSNEEEKNRRSYGGNKNNFFSDNRKSGSANTRGMGRNYNFEKKYGSGKQYANTPAVPTMNRKQRRLLERTGAEMRGSSVLPNYPESSVKRKYGHIHKQLDCNIRGVAEKETLHPSWEAKRKQRAQQILPFQGKKIKFDDDDD